MTVQPDLFAWAAPPPEQEWKRWRHAPRYGFRQYWPCACGRTHSGIVLDYPWSMVALQHWRVSAPAGGVRPSDHAREEADHA